MFLSRKVQSLIHTSISPCLLAFSMLQIVLPLSFISRAIYVNVHSVSVGLIIDPVALVNVSIDVYELAMAMGSVIPPLPFVARTIRPYLHTIAIAESAYPLTLVGRASLESVQRAVFALSLRVVLLLGHCLTGFLHCEILAVSLNIR